MEEQFLEEPPLFSQLSRIDRITSDHVFYIQPQEKSLWRGPLILSNKQMVHLRTNEEVPGPIHRLVHLPLLQSHENPPIDPVPGLPAWVRNQENLEDPVYLVEVTEEIAENPKTELQRMAKSQWELAKKLMLERNGVALKTLRIYPGGMIRGFVKKD